MDEGLDKITEGQLLKGMGRGHGNRLQKGDAKGRP